MGYLVASHFRVEIFIGLWTDVIDNGDLTKILGSTPYLSDFSPRLPKGL
ncbi:MAG: hypothetical protein RIE73_18170 [Coleofasciculus sp. C1-SOL-03]